MATLASYALTSVSDVKETLGISSGEDSKDNLITRKINQATDMMERWCGYNVDQHFAETTYTNEEYDGNGSNRLILRNRPVTSITSFQYRDTTQNTDDWTDVESELYFRDEKPGIISLLFTQTDHFQRYRVSYVAGYSTIPHDLAEACATLAAYLTDNSQTGVAVKRKEEGQREIEYFQPQQGSSLIEQLGIDDVLAGYCTVPFSKK